MKKATSLLLCAVIILALVVACAKPVAPLTASELLDLGEKFLIELNYEQAIVHFLAVIEVEPMNARAYIGAAEAYLGVGDTDAAVAILQQGLASTGDAAIAAMLASLTEPKTAADEGTAALTTQETAAPYTYELGTEFTLQDLADWGYPWGMSGEEVAEIYGYRWREGFQEDLDNGRYYVEGANGGPGYHYDDKTLPLVFMEYENCLIGGVFLRASDGFEGVWFRGLELGMTPAQVMERFRHDRPIAEIIAEAESEISGPYVDVYGNSDDGRDADEQRANIHPRDNDAGVREIKEIRYYAGMGYHDPDGAYLCVEFENGVATKMYINYGYE